MVPQGKVKMDAPNTLKMSVQDVQRRVQDALERSECPAESKRIFELDRVPRPTPRMVELDEFHTRSPQLSPGLFWTWCVSEGGPQSVFFDEVSGLFGVCWGPDRETGGYMDLGYRSQDPVEMSLV